MGSFSAPPSPFTSQPLFQVYKYVFSYFIFSFCLYLPEFVWKKIIVVISCLFLLVLLITYFQKMFLNIQEQKKKDLSNFLMKYWHTIFLPIPFLNGLCQVQVLMNSKCCSDSSCLENILFSFNKKIISKINSFHELAYFLL